MSLYGKNTKSIRKKDIAESKVKPLALNKIQFWHQATAGETGIDLGSLVMPSAVANNGNSNPSSTLLLEQNLFRYKDSVKVVSSLTGELMKSSFKISGNSRITFVGFTTQEGEYFEVTIDPVLRNGVQVVDSRIETASGTVAIGATDFNLGFETSAIREELIVIKDNLVMQRNSNNSSTVQDGDYYIVDSGSGAGTVVRLNTPVSGQDSKMFATAVGNIIDAPSDSTFSALETVQGQIDAMIPTLALLAGVPESNFQSGPNSVALKAFGDKLINIMNLNVELPKKVHEVFFAEDQSNLLSNGGFFHPDPADFADTEGSGLIVVTESGGTTRFNFTKKVKLTISMTIFVDENTGIGQLTTLLNGGAVHRTASTRDERALSNNLTIVVSPGDEITFGMTVGNIYSIGSVCWCRMFAESLEENGKIGDLI